MKKLTFIFFYLAAITMISCNQGENSAHTHKQDAAHDHELAHTNEPAAVSTSGNYGLELNNGKKWDADEPTRVAFDKIQTQLASFTASTPNPVLADYNKLGNNMQAELDILFKTCKMKGKAHDQLHTLLETIIADVKALKGNDEKAAEKAYKALP
ncbi:MAG: hypothetical protein ACXWW0_10360, partial [Bacteroidia bacterium]